ncbi:MAG: hypothetical protein NZ602_10515 [Thermoguttaceae bacterium]|nr:hypothetical protein [Thermoguttaceae bacterium]MDW8037861.1 hypothetical protein [Thermoguttaceae bacterium]
MKSVAYVLAGLLVLGGLIFIVGWQGQWARLVVGLVLWAAAGALVVLARMQPAQTTLVQKIDLSGDVHLQNLTCRQCGGSLGPKSITIQAGAVFVHCEYCGTAYQLEEEPKW